MKLKKSGSKICANPACDKPNFRYGKTCGNNECIQAVKRQTNIEKYGHVSNLHGPVGKQKVRKTLARKYGSGITNISQIPSVKEKKRKTCQRNFGTDWPMQSEEVQEKSRETCLEKYGVDNVRKAPEIIEKIRKSWYKLDPKTGMSRIESAMIQRKKTCQERYGHDHYRQSEEFREYYIRLMLEAHGVDNYWKSEEFLAQQEKRFAYKRLSLTEHQLYYHQVKKITEKTFRENFDLLCEMYVRGLDYHLDHIYSISMGFIHNISPEVISSIVNLQIIPANVNKSKGSKCWIDKEDLLEKFEKLCL